MYKLEKATGLFNDVMSITRSSFIDLNDVGLMMRLGIEKKLMREDNNTLYGVYYKDKLIIVYNKTAFASEMLRVEKDDKVCHLTYPEYVVYDPMDLKSILFDMKFVDKKIRYVENDTTFMRMVNDIFKAQTGGQDPRRFENHDNDGVYMLNYVHHKYGTKIAGLLRVEGHNLMFMSDDTIVINKNVIASYSLEEVYTMVLLLCIKTDRVYKILKSDGCHKPRGYEQVLAMTNQISKLGMSGVIKYGCLYEL